MLGKLPQTWGGVTASGYLPVVTQAQSGGLPNAPFSIEHAFTAQSQVTLTTGAVTRDLYHRFYEHQMQIGGGRNDGYAAWSDAGGLAVGHYDYSHSALFALAGRYVLADHFFQGAFGGSFLNPQYLPQGNLNQHAGYASVADGDVHVADLVAKPQAGPQWNDMGIVITYHEYGGAWDHMAPPRGDLLGPGAG